jgi:hypothetical protein
MRELEIEERKTVNAFRILNGLAPLLPQPRTGYETRPPYMTVTLVSDIKTRMIRQIIQ